MDKATYATLRSRARRLTARPEEAEDLVQQALLAGLEAGRDDLPWLSGTLRNLAALDARSAVRRRRREQALVADSDRSQDAEQTQRAPGPVARWMAALPPSARRVAVLALHGLGPDEIRWILGIADTALRQRLTRIRKAVGELPPAQRAEAQALAYLRDPARSVELQFGLVRRALQAVVLRRPGLGTHDADGHLLVIHRRAHKSPPTGNP